MSRIAHQLPYPLQSQCNIAATALVRPNASLELALPDQQAYTESQADHLCRCSLWPLDNDFVQLSTAANERQQLALTGLLIWTSAWLSKEVTH